MLLKLMACNLKLSHFHCSVHVLLLRFSVLFPSDIVHEPEQNMKKGMNFIFSCRATACADPEAANYRLKKKNLLKNIYILQGQKAVKVSCFCDRHEN